jgi:hypothetical protein
MSLEAGSDLRNVLGRGALLALDDVELDPLALVESLESLTLDCAVMAEYILATVIAGDEAIALLGVEPLYCARRTHVLYS